MPIDLLIHSGKVVRPTGVEILDLAIEDEKIVELGRELSVQARESIDATDQFIFPGVIDSHVHFNEPGRTDWEGFETGSMALAAGGGTCFFDMPLNSSPPVLDGESFDRKLECARAKSYTDFALWGGLTPSNLDRMEELAERGVVGFKAFMSNSGIEEFARVDSFSLDEGMQRAARLGLPVAVHAENQDHLDGAWDYYIHKNRMPLTSAAWCLLRPFAAEIEAITQAVLVASRAKCKLHVVHVSTRLAAGLVARLKAALPADVTCETCPHYFTLTASDVERMGAVAKCAPPIRQAEGDKLIDALMRGLIDTVGSDHSPSSPDLKAKSFFEAWGGIAGVQSTLVLLLTRGHQSGQLSLERLAETTSQAPAERFSLNGKGHIATGYDADLVLVDPAKAVDLQAHHLLQRHKVSPYIGMKIHGMIQRTILRGRTIFADGKIVGSPGGKFIRPVRG